MLLRSKEDVWDAWSQNLLKLSVLLYQSGSEGQNSHRGGSFHQIQSETKGFFCSLDSKWLRTTCVVAAYTHCAGFSEIKEHTIS